MPELNEIRSKVDELVELTRQASEVKSRTEQIKAWFETVATDELRNTKLKTAEYWGSDQSRVMVSNSETVKPVSMTMIKKMMGDVFGDFVKEETTYKMTEPCKRLFAMVFTGAYLEGTLDAAIDSISQDEKIQRTLRKKLKGKYEKDTVTLMTVAGLPETTAKEWAYLTAEIINWEWLIQILAAAGWEGSPQEAIDIIKAAIIVDEGLKVTVEVEKEKP